VFDHNSSLLVLQALLQWWDLYDLLLTALLPLPLPPVHPATTVLSGTREARAGLGDPFHEVRRTKPQQSLGALPRSVRRLRRFDTKAGGVSVVGTMADFLI